MHGLVVEGLRGKCWKIRRVSFFSAGKRRSMHRVCGPVSIEKRMDGGTMVREIFPPFRLCGR